MNTATISKILWSCRRGMKELDLLLLPFAESVFYILSEQQKKDFEQLLLLDDLTLFDCLFKQKKLSDPHLQSMINLLMLFRQQRVAD